MVMSTASNTIGVKPPLHVRDCLETLNFIPL
jgi:hypothetical protein